MFYDILCQVSRLWITFMNDIFKRIQPIDVIAIITIIGGFILKFTGADGTVGTILTMIVAFYFSKKAIYDEIKTSKPTDAKTKTVEQQIRDIASDEGVDPDLTVRVAKCESGLNCSAVGKNTNGTVDRGLFQWNDKWHPEITDECAFNLECSTHAFCKAFKEGHLSWWDCSKKCWNV